MQQLWDYALKLYARPGVESACLHLQEAGADVCLLLAGAWLQRRGTPCRDEYLEALHALADAWQQDIVTPLRQTRRSWREQATQDAELAALREQLKGLELEAERLLLQRLAALAESWPSGVAEDDWLSRLAGEECDGTALRMLRGAVAQP